MTVEITQVTQQTIDDLAHLLSEYQTFYKAVPDHQHNLKFLEHFLTSDDGTFFIAKNNNEAIGYVSLYFSYSSVSAKRIAILNDLYVKENNRQCGLGKKLIDYAITHAQQQGIKQVRWCTRIDNVKAQKLYAKYDAVETDWFHYDLYQS